MIINDKNGVGKVYKCSAFTYLMKFTSIKKRTIVLFNKHFKDEIISK